LLQHYSKYLKEKKLLVDASFDYNHLTVEDSYITYQGIKAKQLVFAMGYGSQQNPYFNYLPLNGTKGELLTIRAPLLKEQQVIKSSVFIIPLGEDQYRIGATYKWQDKTNLPTEAAKSELLEKLATFMTCDYEILHHVAGIRPTVADRRPLVGQHPKHKNLFILNGFGSRGVMIAPFASKALFNAIENGIELPKDMDIVRFQKRYKRL
jgi:glycine/D-amino acid oxidase-like deaminating enzyme